MIRSATLRLSTTLLVSASALSLAVPALAQDVLFASNGPGEARVGQRVTQTQGLTQIRLEDGATISVLDRADYRVNADGTVDLYGGSITVAGGDGEVIVRMPEGVTGEVSGTGSAASFSVAEDGEGRGHVLTGSARIGRGDNLRRFSAGEMFAFSAGERVRQVVSNGAQATPDGTGTAGNSSPQVANLGQGGPVAAARNGLPVTLGDALAAAGASSDIVAAARRVDAGSANPAIETFPTGDLGLLVASAAGLENAYGGAPFPGAQADIIRTYLGFLAEGGAGSEFLSAYAGFLGDYLDLIRSGAAPSGFDATSLAEINSFITYRGRTGGFGTLAASDRVLAEAYLAFLLGGGNADQFAGTFTDLTNAYFAFVRAGGDPTAFGGASQATLDEYIAFLADSGLVQQLSADNRALVSAYLANGGLAFTGQYQAALSAYSDYLARGGLPSAYGALDQATLRAYLETLADTGLLSTITAGDAGFYADYLAFLRAGGGVDAFAGLPVNIFTGYASELDAYFAFLAGGNLPSEYTGGDIAELQGFVSQLAAVGALEAFVGEQAAFFAAFNNFTSAGGDVDAFDQLNANIFAGYAVSLDAYFAFLNGGGLPSAYTDEQVEVLNSYLAQLAAAGALDRFLGAEADFFADYLAFLQSGGQIDTFAQLNANIFAGYASDLADYYAYLENGGVPSAYGELTQETISDYLAALAAVGATDSFLADLAAFYSDYFAFVAGGGNPDNFAGLPVPPDFPAFASALNAFVLFLDNGGLPSGYTEEELGTLQTYLEAIVSSGQLADLLGSDADLLTAYFAFLSSGGATDGFTGLPVYSDYVDQLNAYYAFLANGGLPQDYTAIDPAVLELYLAALNGAGGLAAFTDLDAFFAQYYAFVSGGGDPAQFAGLPVYADYVSALNAYYAFLAGGGLPSDYTALTQVQIEAYLSALAGVQGGFATFGSLNGFFADYFAFVRNGGDPADYTALPVYESYLAAVAAFYNFLAAGNVPSDYTALTEAQIEAYLDALAGLGLLAGEYDGEVLAFFQNYLAFLAGGGMGDNFTGGFPTTPIGGGGLIYAGGFDGTRSAILAVGPWIDTGRGQTETPYSRDLSFSGSTPYTAVISDDGGLEQYVLQQTGFVFANRGTAQVVDIFGDEDILIGRWTDGTYQRSNGRGELFDYTMNANQGFHYVIATGFAGEAAFPTGRIYYDLLAATQPTTIDGSIAPGTFDARAAIIFGAAPAFAIEGSIDFAEFDIDFTTPGGIDGDGLPIFINMPTNLRAGGYFNSRADATASDGRTGQVFFDNQLVDPHGGKFGMRYEGVIFDASYQNTTGFYGAAIFGASQPETGSGGGQADGGLNPVSDFTGTRMGQVFYTYLEGSLNTGFGGSATLESGNLVAFDSIVTDLDRGTASIVDAGDMGTVAWARWTDGTIQSSGLFGNSAIEVGPNGGYHVMSGTPTVTLPASGRVDYKLVGSTAPTDNRGSAPGTITGDLAIQFGSTSYVGYAVNMEVGGLGWGVETTGGVADPTQGLVITSSSAGWTFGGTFVGANVAATGGACATTCIVTIGGQLYGDDADFVGLAMNVTDVTAERSVMASGLAIFGQDTQYNPYLFNAPAIQPSSAPVASAPGSLPAGGGSWERWSVPASASPAGPLPPAAAPGVSAMMSGLTTRDAERMLGGMITFPEAR